MPPANRSPVEDNFSSQIPVVCRPITNAPPADRASGVKVSVAVRAVLRSDQASSGCEEFRKPPRAQWSRTSCRFAKLVTVQWVCPGSAISPVAEVVAAVGAAVTVGG